MAKGGRFGGWVLSVEDGHAGYAYNNLGELTIIKSPNPSSQRRSRSLSRFKMRVRESWQECRNFTRCG